MERHNTKKVQKVQKVQKEAQNKMMQDQSGQLLGIYHAVNCCDMLCRYSPCLNCKAAISHAQRCEGCMIPFCTSIKFVIFHFQHCIDIHCQICGPTRELIELRGAVNILVQMQYEHVENI